MVETAEELIVDKTRHYSYPSMTKTLGSFKLTVEAGSFTDSEIIVMLGENGTGKTTFVRLLAGDTPDKEVDRQVSLQFLPVASFSDSPPIVSRSISQATNNFTQVPWDSSNALAQTNQAIVHAPSVPD